MSEPEHGGGGAHRASNWLRILVPLAVAGVFIFAAWKMGFFTRGGDKAFLARVERIAGRRWLAPGFVAVYATLCAFAMPVTMLAYFAGAVFGFLKGSLYIWIASMLGGTAGYLLARGMLASLATKLTQPLHARFRGLRRDGWAATMTIFRFQLAPLLAFGVVNYAAGIANVRARSFLIGTGLGIIPGTLLAAFVGDRFEAGLGEGNHAALWIAIGISVLLMLVSFAPSLFRRRR